MFSGEAYKAHGSKFPCKVTFSPTYVFNFTNQVLMQLHKKGRAFKGTNQYIVSVKRSSFFVRLMKKGKWNWNQISSVFRVHSPIKANDVITTFTQWRQSIVSSFGENHLNKDLKFQFNFSFMVPLLAL